MYHAVFCVTSIARPSSCEEVPFLVFARTQIAGPIGKRYRAVLKDSPDLGRKLPLAFLAAPKLARLDELQIGVAAGLRG